MRHAGFGRWFGAVIVVLTAITGHAQTPAANGDGLSSAREALESGQYESAEQLATEAYAAFARDTPPSPRSLPSLALLIAARVGNGKSADTETTSLAERAMALVARNPTAEARAEAAEAAGTLFLERGEYSRALNAYRLADSLDGIGAVLIQTQKFKEASATLAAALERHRAGSTPPRAMARTLMLIALVDRFAGEYDKALATMDDVIAREQRAGPVHPDLVGVHQVRGEILFLLGNMPAAEQEFVQAISTAGRTLRPQHPAVIAPTRWLALVATSRGDLGAARMLLERSLPLAEKTVAPCHQEFTAGLDDYASLLQNEGRYVEAQALFDRSLNIRRRCLGPSHSLTATIIHNQAELARQMGDLVTAERLHQQATDIWARGLGPNHPYVARGIDALAEVAQASGQLPKARALYERALALRRRTVGPSHPDVAWTLTNLAEVLLASGNRAAALSRVNEAIDIYQRGGAAQEPDHFARLVMLHATIELASGNLEAAGVSYRRAVDLRREIFGVEHPLSAEAEIGTAVVDFALGRSDAALAAALKAERIGRDHLRFTARYLPERQALGYAAKRPRGLDLALSIAAVNESLDPAPTFDAVIASRGLILDELAARAQLTSTNADSQLTSLNAAMLAARQRFANLMLRSLEGVDPVPARMLEEARQQKEDAERALAERSVTAREEAERAQIGLDDVRRALPPGSALVSFVRYQRTSVVTRPQGRMVTTTASYAALITLAGTNEVRVVPLGTAAAIERSVDIWRAEASGRSMAAGMAPRDAERAYRTAAAALRARVWDPLTSSLAGAARVFVVPDGALNLVNVAALPDGTRYLLESGPAIHYLSTERDLVRSDTVAGRGLLALGGPAFGQRGASTSAAATRGATCGTIGALRFEDLPGSRAEIEDVTRIWGSQDDVVVLSGRGATKSALTNAIGGRRIVHLATHGFFMGGDCTSVTLPGTRGVGGLVLEAPARVDNPLLLTGLALAGVNTLSGARQANAILNAEEIAGLNLQGTEWAVLSACDTGLGQITAGEGVFGLRRALQIAGVHTIIMSLWSVEDQSTREWMKALYDARLEKRLDTPGAVRSASLHVLAQRRARGQSTHPFYWAAFVAAGDWR